MSSNAALKVGDRVEVSYLPGPPLEAELDTFWDAWTLPISFSAAGLFCVLAAIAQACGLHCIR